MQQFKMLSFPYITTDFKELIQLILLSYTLRNII